MTAIQLGVSNYSRTLGRTAPILLHNMYVEKDPSNLVDGTVRLQRAGLAPFATLSFGPIYGVFQQDGTFSGDYLAIGSSTLYRVTSVAAVTALGSLGIQARATFAASATRCLIANGGACWSTDGATITAIVMPNGELVSSVGYIDGYFILTVVGSQHFFWLAPGDVDPDALNFASVENTPDNLTACRVLFDEIWFFGEASVEVWEPTGNIDLPFQRIPGRIYNVGCGFRDAIAVIDNAIYFPGSDGKVYRAGQNAPQRVSDHAIEEAIRRNGSSAMSAWAFNQDGHAFYCLTLDAIGTFVLDVENASWNSWDTYNRDIPTWRARVGTDGNSADVLCGDDLTADLYKLTPGRGNDNGDIIVREIVGGVAVLGKPVRCDDIQVFASCGWTPDINLEPVMEVNWSDDQGQTYPGPWMPMSLGVQGAYDQMCYAQQLGVINPPGRLFKLRMTDDANWRISYCRMNEMNG